MPIRRVNDSFFLTNIVLKSVCTRVHECIISTNVCFSSIPDTAPMVFSTFGKLSSVRTPSPPTAGPHEKGPAVKSINAHLTEKMMLACHLTVIVFLKSCM